MSAVLTSGRALVIIAASVVAGSRCGGGDGGTGPTPSISLSLLPTGATVVRGGTQQIAGTLTRNGGFTGSVTVSVQGAPSGVTGSVGTVVNNGNQTTVNITIQVGAAAPLGIHQITVRATGSGVADAVANFQLTVAAQADFSLGVAPAAVTLVPGTSRNDIAVTITRTEFTGPVTLNLTGPVPTGVTASFAPGVPTETAAILTLTIGAAVAPGSYNLTIEGTGSAGTRTTPFVLTVASFAVSVNPAAVQLIQTLSVDIPVTITRTSYAGTVVLSVENLPQGVSAEFTPPSTTGNSSTLTLTATGAAVPGPYTVTVRGTGPDAAIQAVPGSGGRADLASTATVNLTLNPANMRFNFTSCGGEVAPLWFAFQNGNGPWTRVTETSPGVYVFHISQDKGGFAITASGILVAALRSGPLAALRQASLRRAARNGARPRGIVANDEVSGTGTLVFYGSREELTGITDLVLGGLDLVGGCTTPEPGMVINGTVTGVDPSEYVFLNMGGSTDSRGGSGSFQLRTVASGPQDFLAYKTFFGAAAFFDMMVLRRDQDFADNSTMPPVTMTGGDAFAPEASWMMLTNQGADEVYHDMHYYTTSACRPATVYVNSFVDGSWFYGYGVPPARQRVTDFHELILQSYGPDDDRRLTRSFHTMMDRTFRLPDRLPVPTITSTPGTYKQLGAALMIPSDYTSADLTLLGFAYGHTAPNRGVVILATLAWLGGANASVMMPNFSGLPEWNDSWAPGPSTPGDWELLIGQGVLGNECTEGREVRTADRYGVYP